MEKKKTKKYLAVILLICVLCVSSVFSVDASPKIKSKSVSINVEKAAIGIGDIITLDAVMKPTNSTDTIKWSSSNTKVATVNKYGVVTAIGEGSATITAKTSSKKTAKCTVTVKKQLSEAEISDLISKECLSEETVKKLIKENTLSEDDVKKIVAENSDGDTSGSDTDWEDGTELKILSGQTLPYSGNGVTIEKITVRKYHYDGEWNGTPQKYKYTIEVEGSLPENIDNSEHDFSFVLHFMNKYAYYNRSYGSEIRMSGTDVTSYSENGRNFILTADQYNIYSDCDEYMVEDLEFSSKD